MKKLLILIPLLVLISCGVQKRKYQKGYYVNWTKSKTQQDKKEVLAKAKAPEEKKVTLKTSVAPIVSPQKNEETQELEASASKEIGSVKHKKTLIQKDEPCDQLIFKDGSEIQGKVIEITETEVRYKKCSMLDGPVYVGKKSDIFMVKYANGTKEVFSTPKNVPESGSKEKYKGPVYTHPLAVWSLILGIIGIYPAFFVGGILALIFGRIAKKAILAQPEKYKGMGMANAGIILGIIDICVVVAIALIFILAVILFI